MTVLEDERSPVTATRIQVWSECEEPPQLDSVALPVSVPRATEHWPKREHREELGEERGAGEAAEDQSPWLEIKTERRPQDPAHPDVVAADPRHARQRAART